jgi:hypothetical protein
MSFYFALKPAAIIRIAIVALVIWTLCYTTILAQSRQIGVLRDSSAMTTSISSKNDTVAAAVSVAVSLQHEHHARSPPDLAAVSVPKHRKIPQYQAVMLHVGKAGGGTFDLRTRQWWHVTIEKTCHPQPCLHASFDLADINETTVFISVRDPVDRFVSAFYWRLQLWCRKDQNETRIAGGPAPRYPHQYCNYYRPAERKVLFERYRENANLLAESLCNDDDNDNGDHDHTRRNSNATMVQAAQDVRLIGHLLASLFHWLGPDWQQKNATLFPIVLEQRGNFSFESQIDDGMRFLQNRKTTTFTGTGIIDANPVDFRVRQDYVDYMDRLVVQQQQQQQQKQHPSSNSKNNSATTTATIGPAKTLTAIEAIQASSHSSSSTTLTNDNRSHDERHQQHRIHKIPLSARGERCVARYYERDYQIIRDLSIHACKTATCQAALQSIVRRRAHLLGWEL